MTDQNHQDRVAQLLQIMAALRGPGGCPWDTEQTPESLAPYILEEACELIDAIEGGTAELILDELGDLLLQVVFQAQIFSERGMFDFQDVAGGIAEKLLRRHPHVFDRGHPAADAGALNVQWEEIKRSEATNVKSCLADHLPGNLPALQRAQKLVKRISSGGRQAELTAFAAAAWPNADEPTGGDMPPLDEDTLGLALFQLARAAHEAGLDAESALRRTTRKLVHLLDPD